MSDRDDSTRPAPTPDELIRLLRAAHDYAVSIRDACGRRSIMALYGVVIVALDSALVFAIQAHQLTQKQHEDTNHGRDRHHDN